jgi:3-deoxy-D-manno-octulosonic-acid transferase
VANGGAIVIENALELEKTLDELFSHQEEIVRRGNIAGEYVQTQKGATEKIMNYIQANRLLTN